MTKLSVYELNSIAHHGLPRPDIDTQVVAERDLARDLLAGINVLEQIKREAESAGMESISSMCRIYLKDRDHVPAMTSAQRESKRICKRRSERKLRAAVTT